MSTKPFVVVLAIACALGAGGQSVRADDLFWTVTDAVNSIVRAAGDGTNQVTIFTDSQLEPRDLVLDLAGAKMYFVEARTPGTANKIMRMNLDGTNAEDLVLLGSAVPNFLSLDIAGGKMYWTQLQEIHRANLDGSAQEMVFTMSSVPAGFAISGATQKLFWLLGSFTTNTRIRSANLDGTNAVDVLTVPGDLPFAGFSVGGGKLYWGNFAHQLRRANIDGTGLTTVWTSPDGTDFVFRTFADETDGFIYWVNLGSVASIRRADLNGVGAVDLAAAPIGAGFVDVEHVAGAGIPTVSQWGLAMLALGLLAAGTIAFHRHRVAAV